MKNESEAQLVLGVILMPDWGGEWSTCKGKSVTCTWCKAIITELELFNFEHQREK